MTFYFRSALILITLMIIPVSAFSQSAAPIFPVKLLDAVTYDHVDEGGIIYEQSFRPQNVVKTNEPFHFPLKSYLIFASHPDITVPADTLLIEAFYDGQTAYCGAFRQKKPDMNGASDVGFCMRDPTQSGVFVEIAYFTANPDPVRTPYEAHEQDLKKVKWTPLHLPYETITVDGTLSGKIQVHIVNGTRNSKRPLSKIKWPERLTVDLDTTDQKLLTSVIWPNQGIYNAMDGDLLKDSFSLSSSLSVLILHENNGYTAKWLGTPQNGDAILGMRSITRSGIHASQYIYEINHRKGQ